MNKAKRGLSADCKLPPEITIGLQLSGEHPCDRCNHDRSKCRGEPRKQQGGFIDGISVFIQPENWGTNSHGQCIFQVELRVNGKSYSLREIYPDDMLESMFDRLWESAGVKIKHALKGAPQ